MDQTMQVQFCYLQHSALETRSTVQQHPLYSFDSFKDMDNMKF